MSTSQATGEHNMNFLRANRRRLSNLKENYTVTVSRQRDIVDRLEDLGEIMAIMLDRQESVKVRTVPSSFTEVTDREV